MKCKVVVITDPICVSVNNFAAKCNRFRSQIEKAISDDKLNFGEVYGKKVVILDAKAIDYRSACKNWDKVKK